MKNKKNISQTEHFQPVETVRSSQQVARAIRDTIIEGKFSPGENLPPERTMAAKFRVTRNTVREALRQLEQIRLVSIRQGSGARVEDYLASTGLEFVASLIGNSGSDRAGLIRDIATARQVIGEAMVLHAVDTLDTARLDDLRKAIEDFIEATESTSPDVRRLQELDFEIHNRLMRAGGNRAIILLHNSIRHIYRKVAGLFEPLMTDPQALAGYYRDALAALEADDRTRARDIFRAYFADGAKALESFAE